MPKSDLPLGSGDYAPVAARITLFYATHPSGRIITELIERGAEVVFKASVYRCGDDLYPAATGWASERIGDGDVNTVACLENTETSAIGRALANLGFTASAKRPSTEEMTKASRERLRGARSGGSVDSHRAATKQDRTGSSESSEARQHHADAVSDALGVLRLAQRHGLRPRRAMSVRERLVSGRIPEGDVVRTTQHLRRWVRKQVARDMGELPRIASRTMVRGTP